MPVLNSASSSKTKTEQTSFFKQKQDRRTVLRKANAIQADAKARHQHPGRLRKTYREAENWVMYRMK